MKYLFDPLRVAFPGVQTELPATQFVALADEGAPARLGSYTVTAQGELRNSTLVNTSKKKIVRYQIGWVTGGTSRSATLKMWPALDVADPIPPGAERKIANFAFPTSLLHAESGLARVGFFVSAVKFDDGTSWHADLRSIKRHALPVRAPSNGVDNPAHGL